MATTVVANCGCRKKAVQASWLFFVSSPSWIPEIPSVYAVRWVHAWMGCIGPMPRAVIAEHGRRNTTVQAGHAERLKPDQTLSFMSTPYQCQWLLNLMQENQDASQTCIVICTFPTPNHAVECWLNATIQANHDLAQHERQDMHAQMSCISLMNPITHSSMRFCYQNSLYWGLILCQTLKSMPRAVIAECGRRNTTVQARHEHAQHERSSHSSANSTRLYPHCETSRSCYYGRAIQWWRVQWHHGRHARRVCQGHTSSRSLCAYTVPGLCSMVLYVCSICAWADVHVLWAQNVSVLCSMLLYIWIICSGASLLSVCL